jgi:hypothetical protein
MISGANSPITSVTKRGSRERTSYPLDGTLGVASYYLSKTLCSVVCLADTSGVVAARMCGGCHRN